MTEWPHVYRRQFEEIRRWGHNSGVTSAKICARHGEAIGSSRRRSSASAPSSSEPGRPAEPWHPSLQRSTTPQRTKSRWTRRCERRLQRRLATLHR
jgi:hypothetical protein